MLDSAQLKDVFSSGPLMAASNGLDAFLAYLSKEAQAAPTGFAGAAWFVLRIGDDCAYIRLQDMWQPLRFLRQMAGNPPLRFVTEGFDPLLVDDFNPARHYVAFVWLGFWLPRPLALAALYTWETAGFVRYGLQWSRKDVRSGLIGLRHGALVRRYGPTLLPGLVAGELSPRPSMPASPSRQAAASRQ